MMTVRGSKLILSRSLKVNTSLKVKAVKVDIPYALSSTGRLSLKCQNVCVNPHGINRLITYHTTFLHTISNFRQLLAKVIVAEGRELDLEVGDEVLAMQRMPSPCLVVENVIRLVRTSNCDIVYNTRMKDIRPMIEA